MKELHIDIETYSSADLAKCGVYKYTESPDFEILLFGYSRDEAGTQCLIRACLPVPVSGVSDRGVSEPGGVEVYDGLVCLYGTATVSGRSRCSVGAG